MRSNLRVLLLATTIFHGWTYFSLSFGQEPDPPRARFIPRDDENAARDLEALRYALSRAKDSLGNIDPLADYAPVPSPRVAAPSPRETEPQRAAEPPRIGEDNEAKQTPKLEPSAGGEYRTPRMAWQSCVELPGARVSPAGTVKGSLASAAVSPASRTGTGQLADGFRPNRIADDQEAQSIPSLSEGVTYASATIPLATTESMDRISRYQDIPFGSQGTPTMPVPNLGSSIPNYPAPPSYPGTGVYPPAAPIVPPTTTPIVPPTATPVVPPSYPVNPSPIYPVAPPTYPVAPPATAPVYPPLGTVMPTPPPTYVPTVPTTPLVTVPPPTIGYPIAAAPTQIPSTMSEPSRYGVESSIVNFKPFVSAPPRQVDARYMVSPTLFRPQTSNCTTCASGTPYAAPPVTGVPGAGPLTYAPPTYYPTPTNYNGYDSGYRSLIGFGQDITQARLGRGIVGQPTAYMPSQPVRNFLRYIFP